MSDIVDRYTQSQKTKSGVKKSPYKGSRRNQIQSAGKKERAENQNTHESLNHNVLGRYTDTTGVAATPLDKVRKYRYEL